MRLGKPTMRFHVFPRSWQGYQDSCHWVECNVNTNTIQRQRKQLINVSYNPCKSLHHDFLEDLAMSIDHVVVENKPLCIMGDFNIV